MGAGQAHGFARNTSFAVAQQAEDSVALVLAASDETKKLFPHSFQLEVVVVVSDDAGGTLSQMVLLPPPL